MKLVEQWEKKKKQTKKEEIKSRFVYGINQLNFSDPIAFTRMMLILHHSRKVVLA